ncbi:MAG: hypothetical protein N3G76_02835 [Candidatus Micrarchaeota archaeon]|nr:hypothetical protein [Candidatus Micrarchaeota archaeon]
MRGFLYTVIVLILAVSFMYVLTIQNSLPPLFPEDRTVQEVRQAARALYGVNVSGNTISGTVGPGKPIRVNEFSQVLDNYNKLRNAGLNVHITPRFVCGDTVLGYTGLDRNAWSTELKHKTEIIVRPGSSATITSKRWEWAGKGTLLRLTVQDDKGKILLDEEGYINETISNYIEIADESGNVAMVKAQNGELTISGKCSFTQKIYAGCSIFNQGYIEKDGIRHKV